MRAWLQHKRWSERLPGGRGKEHMRLARAENWVECVGDCREPGGLTEL